jgi:hypothetical protein
MKMDLLLFSCFGINDDAGLINEKVKALCSHKDVILQALLTKRTFGSGEELLPSLTLVAYAPMRSIARLLLMH